MTLAYRNFSSNAANCERLGNFTEAARFWIEAKRLANGVNQQWAETRAEFCQRTAARLKIK